MKLNSPANIEKPMGGFSSLIFVMISGSALYYAPYAVGNVSLFVLAVSFVLSFLLLKLYTALSENKTRPFCRLITVLIVPAALIQLGVRLFDFFELCAYSGEKYTGNAFMFLALAAISFIALYSVHNGRHDSVQNRTFVVRASGGLCPRLSPNTVYVAFGDNRRICGDEEYRV